MPDSKTTDPSQRTVDAVMRHGPSLTPRPEGDMWRVDVAGYPVMVRGEDAYRHLQRINSQNSQMKLALHRIAKFPTGADYVAEQTLKNCSND